MIHFLCCACVRMAMQRRQPAQAPTLARSLVQQTMYHSGLMQELACYSSRTGRANPNTASVIDPARGQRAPWMDCSNKIRPSCGKSCSREKAYLVCAFLLPVFLRRCLCANRHLETPAVGLGMVSPNTMITLQS